MNIAIILLGGSSKRLNLNTPKQFIKLMIRNYLNIL